MAQEFLEVSQLKDSKLLNDEMKIVITIVCFRSTLQKIHALYLFAHLTSSYQAPLLFLLNISRKDLFIVLHSGRVPSTTRQMRIPSSTSLHTRKRFKYLVIFVTPFSDTFITYLIRSISRRRLIISWCSNSSAHARAVPTIVSLQCISIS